MNHIEINRELYRRGITQVAIARATATARGTVWRVIHGKAQTPVIRRFIAVSIDRSYQEVWGDPDPGFDRMPSGRRPEGL